MANMSLEKIKMPEQAPDVRNKNFKEVSLGYTEEMAIEEAQRCLNCKHKPCVSGCPVNVRIPEFIAEVAKGDFMAAYKVITSTNALPAVCGRVCPQESQCESKCVRGMKGEAVAIGRLERFVADWYMKNCDELPEKPASNGKKVAVIGSGPSALACAGDLAKQGYDVTMVAPRADGTLDIDAMLERVDKNTILVACMMVNNEIGTRNDVERLAAEVKRRNSRTIVHVDAVQAWMRVPIKLDNIDTLSVSGHKIHAPKGIGALYLSDRLVQAFQPPYLGGEQERQMRPGTENLPYAMGLAAAATRLAKTMKSRDTAMRALNRQLRA